MSAFQPREEIPSTPEEPAASTPRPIGPIFWTITGSISLIFNVILVIVLLVVANQFFAIKDKLNDELLGGLYQNFVLMDTAHIRTTIPVTTEVNAKFDLPLQTNTTVVLSQDTYINNAIINLNTGGLLITNAPADIVLPAGTELPITLDLSVPVDQKIPVSLDVTVDIPVQDTELHQPLTGLQNVVSPYYLWIQSLPGSWGELLFGK